MRTAAAGSSSIAITSDAASTSTRVGQRAAGQVRGDRVGHRRRAARRRRARPRRAAPPATISAGARSPPIASSAITGVTASPRRSRAPCASRQRRSLDVENLPTSVVTTVAAHRVRELRRAAVRAQRVRARDEPHVGGLARAGRGTTHLALRDSHRSTPVRSQLERPQGRPAGVDLRGDALAAASGCGSTPQVAHRPAQSASQSGASGSSSSSASRTSGSRSITSSSSW